MYNFNGNEISHKMRGLPEVLLGLLECAALRGSCQQDSIRPRISPGAVVWAWAQDGELL